MRKKRIVAALLAGFLAVGGFTAVAAEPGSAGDPFISLQWLKETFIPRTVSQGEEIIDKRYEAVSAYKGAGEELRLKKGDVLRMETGTTLLSLAGAVSVTSSGTVIDLSNGVVFSAEGAAVPNDHLCLVAENTTAAFSATSDTVVLRLDGRYQLSISGEVDYNAMADVLKELGLFRGSDTPYGSGYDLEVAPTRLQGLILFLRLLGEEKAALAYTAGTAAFADVPSWALPYVSYAYDRGYTKGQGVNEQGIVTFGSDGILAARDYMTFLLRALGYREGSHFQWLTAVEDACSLGVLTAGEGTRLSSGTDFLRAQVVYLSYYTLSAQFADSEETLMGRLYNSGVLPAVDIEAVYNRVPSTRIQ